MIPAGPQPPPDLAALVLELEARSEAMIDNHLGRAIQRFGLSVLQAHDPELSRLIHDADDLKPFAVSGLMRGERLYFGRAEVGQRAWIRLSGLSEAVVTALCAYHAQVRAALAADQAPLIDLDRQAWAIRASHLDDGHPWCGLSSYQVLIERQRTARPPQALRLIFATPTTFRSQTVNVPLPLPRLVFGGLLNRWTAFTPHRLRDLPDEQVMRFIDHHLVIRQYQLQTHMVRGKQGGQEVGFVGEVTYELLRVSDYLAKHEPELERLMQGQWAWFARTVGLLADLARWSGVGRKTPSGLGLAREG